MKPWSFTAVLLGLIYLASAGLAATPFETEERSKPVRWNKATMAEPKLIRKVSPKYPPEAKKERVEGTVILDATIAKDGAVRETRVKKKTDSRLVKAAREAVALWRYAPVRDAEGTPIEVLFTVTVRFALE